MFLNKPLLRKSLSKKIGFYQTKVTSQYPQLSPSLVKSPISRFVNEVHGLIDVENIHQSTNNFSALNVDSWDVLTAYDEEDLVNDNGDYFEAVQNVPAGTLTSDTNYWFPLDGLNIYLWSKRMQGVDKTLDYVFTGKKTRNKVKSIFENIALYDGFGENQEVNNNKIVGLRFTVKYDRDIVTIINKIGHQFTEAVSFNMELYHSSQEQPLETIPINHTKVNSSQWTSQSDLILRYLDDNYDAGGEFVLKYNQSDLGTSQAYNMHSLDWTNGYSCRSCKSYELYKNYSSWIKVSAFEMNESDFSTGRDLFDSSKISMINHKNYGINLNMTTECDLTPFIIQEGDILGEALMYSTGLEILRDMASNTRSTNQRGNLTREEARKEIVTFDGVRGTVLDITNDTLKGLSFDLSGLDSACLPCHNPVVNNGGYSLEIVLDNPNGV